MGWTMLYLFVFLKLPILAACYIVWWAVRQGNDTDDAIAPHDGGAPLRPRPHPRRPRRPPPPRRGGPHAAGVRMAPPPRIRSVTAAGRARELEH